jgi:hypothetical protein
MAKPAPKNKLLAIVLPAETHGRLERMAKAAGEPVEDFSERMLRSIADEFVKHAEAA